MRDSASSSSHNPRGDTIFANRLNTIFKKAHELSTLCGVEVSVIYYGPDGTLKTWPEERDKVKDMALRYTTATKRKNSLNLREFLDDGKNKKTEKKSKKMKRELEIDVKYPTWYPVFDHYSPDQLSELIMSLEKTLSTLQERVCVIKAKKQRNTSMVHQVQYQNQPFNPSQFSLVVYNHGDRTLSKLPISALHANQLAKYQNNFMQKQELYDLDHNLTNAIFQQPCFSNTQDSSSLLSEQEAGVSNYMMKQHELYGFDQNMTMMMSDVTNSNVPCLSSNTVSDVSCSDFKKNPYGVMLGSSSSFSQDHPDMLSSYDESSLIQKSSLPSLQTIPNNYLLSNDSRFV